MFSICFATIIRLNIWIAIIPSYYKKNSRNESTEINSKNTLHTERSHTPHTPHTLAYQLITARGQSREHKQSSHIRDSHTRWPPYTNGRVTSITLDLECVWTQSINYCSMRVFAGHLFSRLCIEQKLHSRYGFSVTSNTPLYVCVCVCVCVKN